MRKWEVWCDSWDTWSGPNPELVVKWAKVFTDWDEAEAFYRRELRKKVHLTSVHIEELEVKARDERN